MGKKCPLVRTAKALYDITGQRSSLLPILIPFPSLASHCVFFSPSDTFSEPPSVVSSCAVSASLSQLLSAARHTDRQTDRLTDWQSCSDACLWTRAECLMVDIRMPAASCVSLFFYSEARGFQWSEESRAAQEQEGTKESFPPRPLLTQISGCTHLPRILLLSSHTAWGSSAAIIILHFGFPCLPG